METKIKVKKLHPEAVMPKRACEGDAGYDLTAVSVDVERLSPAIFLVTYHTGLAFEIPDGMFGDVRPRSSIYKTGMFMSNSCGVIDSGYRGEVLAKFYSATDDMSKLYKVGDRIAQIIFTGLPSTSLEQTDELSDTARGKGGYGSTGR